MGPVAGDIWSYYDQDSCRHFLFHELISELNWETQKWYALCLNTGQYGPFYWFLNPNWSKVA